MCADAQASAVDTQNTQRTVLNAVLQEHWPPQLFFEAGSYTGLKLTLGLAGWPVSPREPACLFWQLNPGPHAFYFRLLVLNLEKSSLCQDGRHCSVGKKSNLHLLYIFFQNNTNVLFNSCRSSWAKWWTLRTQQEGQHNLWAFLFDSIRESTSPSWTGPLTFRMIKWLVSSIKSTRTCMHCPLWMGPAQHLGYPSEFDGLHVTCVHDDGDQA